MTATEILKKNPKATEHDVRHGLEGNICRCTGYENIVKAIVAAGAVKEARGDRVGSEGKNAKKAAKAEKKGGA